MARTPQFPRGAIVVFDRGYNNYDRVGGLTDRQVCLVTSLKDDANVVAIEDRPIPPNCPVLTDQMIRLHGLTNRGRPGYRFRRVEIEDLEVFFKALKQNLKLKTFVGVTPNALNIQVWTALIAMLSLRYLQPKSAYDSSLSNLAALLRMNLFVHRDLWAWLNKPFQSPPALPEAAQTALPFI